MRGALSRWCPPDKEAVETLIDGSSTRVLCRSLTPPSLVPRPARGGPLLESQRSSLLLILGDQVIELEERLARMQARADTLQEELDHATCERSRCRLTRLFLPFLSFFLCLYLPPYLGVPALACAGICWQVCGAFV